MADTAIAEPRYQRISRALRGRIADGTYAVGAPMPTEAELCAEFEASRFTIREALRGLVASGLVTRRKGSGTVVKAQAAGPGYVHSMASLSDLFAYALDTRFVIGRIRHRRIDARTALEIGAAPDSAWLEITGVRREQALGAPICWTRVLVAARFAPHLHDVRDSRVPIYALIENRSGERIASAEQEFRAEPMGPARCRALGLAPRSWALRLKRRYKGEDGTTLLCSFNWHPAERFSYTMHIRRGDWTA
jgi:DNA-binding GntR family transcriptional regulator